MLSLLRREPLSKKAEKRLQQEQEKRRAARLCQLGWEEVEGWQDRCFQWRCSKCKQPKMYVNCGMCFRCEACYDCDPDTDAGKQAAKDYLNKGKATCNFDIFGNLL